MLNLNEINCPRLIIVIIDIQICKKIKIKFDMYVGDLTCFCTEFECFNVSIAIVQHSSLNVCETNDTLYVHVFCEINIVHVMLSITTST